MTMKKYPATLKLKKELNKIFSYFEREKATYVTREKKTRKVTDRCKHIHTNGYKMKNRKRGK